MSKFENYFNKDFIFLKEPNTIEIQTSLNDKMMLISGDFYGIQKFIFEGLATKNASKVLRAKSAFVQLFTITLARYICHQLSIEEKYIVSANAGKFEILSSVIDDVKIAEIQKEVDKYFITNFYGLSGMSISSMNCLKDDFSNKEKYRVLRKNIADSVEAKKFQKFDLQNQQSILSYDANIDNQSLCKICNIRKGTIAIKDSDGKKCDICDMFIELGKKLVDKNAKFVSSKNDLKIIFGDFDTKIELDKKIKSYVSKNKDDIVDFEKLSEIAQGTNAIGILKADVDGMGNYIKNSDVTDSFENFDLFSKTLDNFFSLHIPKQMKEKYPDTYTVFAGGDDLFLVGSWDVILGLSRWIEGEFKKFVVSKELTISFGVAIAKPSTPISYLAEHTEHLLEEAKAYIEKNEKEEIVHQKDAISLFGETVKWNSYNEVFEKLQTEFKNIKEEELNTAFLYRLLEFCDMSKKAKDDPLNTMWKSKLRYSFSRNNTKLGETFFGILDNTIDNNPSETKMFLSEFIYKRRD